MRGSPALVTAPCHSGIPQMNAWIFLPTKDVLGSHMVLVKAEVLGGDVELGMPKTAVTPDP